MSDLIRLLLQAKIDPDAIKGIQKQIQDLSKNTEPIKIAIDIDDKALKNIDNINKTLQKKLGDTKAPKLVVDIEDSVGRIDRVIQKTDGTTGKLLKTTRDIALTNSESLKIVDRYDKKTGDLVSTTDELTVNYKKQRQEIEKIEKIQSKTLWEVSKERLNNIGRETQEIKRLNNYYKEQERTAQKIAEFQQKMLGVGGIKGEMDIFSEKFTGKYDENVFRRIKTDIEDLQNIPLEQQTARMKELRLQWDLTKKTAMQSGSVMTRAIENMGKFLRFYLVGGTLVKFVGEIRKGISSVVELDKSLTELNKVSEMTSTQMAIFTDRAYEAGEVLARTGKEVVDATVEFRRAGYELEEAFQLGQEALLLTNIGSGIEDVQYASSSLIAILKGFKMEANDTAHVIDALNEVSNNYALDTVNLTEILRRTSGVVAQTGTSYEELLGLSVGAFESLRSAEQVASGINMINQRLRGMAENGEAIEGLIPKIQAAFDKYTHGAVSVIDKQNGGLYSTYEILEQLSKVYPTLTDEAKAYINEAVAGNRQNKVLVAIMENWHNVENAIKSANNSLGSAQKSNEAYLDSIEGRSKQLASSMQVLWKNLINADVIKNGISLLNGLINVLNTISGTALGKVISNTTLLTINLALLGKGLDIFKGKLASSTILINLLAAAQKKLTIETSLLTAALLASPLFKIVVVSAAITTTIGLISKLTTSLKEQKETVETLSSEIEQLQSRYDSLQSETNRTEEQEVYLQLLKQEIDDKKELLKIEKQREIEMEFFTARTKGGVIQDDTKIEKVYKDIERLKQRQKELLDTTNEASFTKISEEVAKLKTSLVDVFKTIEDASGILGNELPKELRELSNAISDVLLQANNSEEFVQSVRKISKGIDDLNSEVQRNLEIFSDSKEAQEELEKIISDNLKAYEDLTSKLQDYYVILDELNSKEGLSAKSKQDIVTKYHELLPYIENEKELRRQLIQIIQQEEEAQRKAYQNMLMYSQDFYNAKLKGNKELVEKLGEYYHKDLENAKSLAEAKAMVEERLIKNISKQWAKFYRVSAIAGEGYVQTMGVGGMVDEYSRNMAENLAVEMRGISRLFDDIVSDFGMPDFKSINMSKIKTPKGEKSKKDKKEYKAIADQYERINQLLADNNNLIEMNRRYINNAKEGSAEQLKLIEKENSLYKERQNLLHQLNEQRRAEVRQLEKDLSKHGFKFVGSGDSRRISNLKHIQGQTKEVEEMFNRFNELQLSLIPQSSQQWWDYQQSVVENLKKIEDTIQSHIDQLETLKDELENFDLAGKIRDLNKQLDEAKFNYWIENLILGLEKYNNKTELLTFKLSLFDEEDYENRANVVADLFSASKEKLEAYREEWDKLSAQTPKNANEASQIANAMRQVQQGMRDAFVATREYQRQLERIQFEAISNEFEKANKQLELQLSIIDHNIQSLKDGILPDFSLDMVMPIPDFSDIFDKTASENEKIYNEQVELEEQILELKKQSYEMQLQEAKDFYVEEMNKLIEHYNKLLEKIAEKEAEIAELKEFLSEEQRKQLKTLNEKELEIIEQHNADKLEEEKEHEREIEEERLQHYGQILLDLTERWINPEYDEITTHYIEIETVTASFLSNLQSFFYNAWSNIVQNTSDALKSILKAIREAQAAMDNIDVPAPSTGADIHINRNTGEVTAAKQVSKYAKGGKTKEREYALVGEEGYELGILPSGQTVLFGKYGSELVDIPKGTVIVPHGESKEIINHIGDVNGGVIPKYKDGTLTWQDKLKLYEVDREAYEQERDRVVSLINSGTAEDMNAAKRWLNQIDEANKNRVAAERAREAEKYAFRNEDMKRQNLHIPDELAHMSDDDLYDYINNKWQVEYNKGGYEYTEANQRLREKYGIDSDRYGYDELGGIKAYLMFPNSWSTAQGGFNPIVNIPFENNKSNKLENGGRSSGISISGGGGRGSYYDKPSRDNVYYVIPPSPPKPPTLNELIGINKPDFFVEMSKEFKKGTGKYAEGLYALLGFEGYDKYLENRKKVIEEIKSGQEDLLNAIDADAINKRKEDLVQALMLDKDLSEVNKKAIKNIDKNLIDKLKELEAEMQELNLQALDNDWYYNAAETIFDSLKVSAPSGSNMSTEEYRNYILEAFRSGEKIDEWIFDVVQTQRDIVAKTIATGGTIEDANNQIKELYGGHLLLQEDIFNTLNDSFIEAPEISELIKTKQDEIKKVQQELFRQIDIRDIIPTEQEVLDMIDQQLLEDARTQSWLKVDLLEQMKASVEKYTTQLKEKYDEALASGNAELAREIFEEYNNMLSKQIQIENQIQRAIKDRYDMEFALIDKKIKKEREVQNSYRQQLDIIKELNAHNYDGFIQYNEAILRAEQNKLNLLKESSRELQSQLNLLEVGSHEWNIVNDRLDKVNDSIRDSTLEIVRQNKEILRQQYERELLEIEKDLFAGRTKEEVQKELDEAIKYQNKYVGGLEKELMVSRLLINARKDNVSLTKEELDFLKQSGDIERVKLERLEKQLNIRKLEQKLANLRNQKTIQQLTKMEDGTWDFTYVADQDAIYETERELKEAKLDLIKWEQDIDNKKQQEDIDARGKYLSELRKLTEKSLNAEYTTHKEFQRELLKLNNSFMLDYALDTETHWASIIDGFTNNLDIMLESYEEYLIRVREITDEIMKLQRQAAIAQVNKTDAVSDILENPDSKQFDDANYTDRHKNWTVKFNQPVDEGTAKNVKVVDKDGNILSTGQIGIDGKSVVLEAPSGGYSTGAYAIVVTKEVSSASGKNLKEEILKNFTVGFDTGGYTGTWGSDGKLAFLHEKELVLNKVDTSNLLKAVNITRDIFSNIKIPTVPKMQPAMSGGGGDQVFNISKLEFPNVRDANEIEKAIKSLSTYANQWANRK